MTTNAISGHKTILMRSRGGYPAADDFEAIAEVRNVSGPEFSLDTLEVTHMLSNFQKEYIPGNKDLGDISMDANFVPGDPTLAEIPTSATPGIPTGGALADYENRVKRIYRIVFPDVKRSFCQFEGFIRQFRTNAAQNDPLSVNLVIKGTGAVLWGQLG